MRQIIFSTLVIGLIGVFTPSMNIVSSGQPSPTTPPHAERETITGVYVRAIEDYWSLLRFYADGTVLAVGVGIGQETLCTAWLNSGKWFR